MLGQVADQHRVDVGLEKLPALGAPHRRLVQLGLTVVVPIVGKLGVGELIREDGVAPVEDTAQLVEAYRRNLVSLDRPAEHRKESLVFVVRQQILDESQEIGCRLVQIRREPHLSMKADAVLMELGTLDCLASFSFSDKSIYPFGC